MSAPVKTAAQLNKEYLSENLVPFPGQQIDETKRLAAEVELEGKRALIIKSLKIAQSQLQHDAEKSLESAIVGEWPPQKRLMMADTARALFIASDWLAELARPVAAPEPEQPNA